MGAFLRLPRQKLEYLKKTVKFCPCHTVHPQEITEEHARTYNDMGDHVRNHDNAVDEQVYFMQSNGCNTYRIIRLHGEGTKGKRADAMVLNLPNRKNRIFTREAHDITICNLECKTNRSTAKGTVDALLILKEKKKADYYEEIYGEANFISWLSNL